MVFSLVRRSLLGATVGAVALVPLLAAAQAWRSGPIRIVVAYPAGGVSDVVARALGERLAVALGMSVVIDNKAGASGVIGVDAVAKAAPDGYTFGFAAISPLALNPHLGRSPSIRCATSCPWPASCTRRCCCWPCRPPRRAISAPCWQRRRPGRARCAGSPRARRRSGM